MKEFTIRENEAGQRLDKYLRKLLPDAPGSFIYKNLRKKNIVLNKKKATGAEQLTIDDIVTCYLSDETFDSFARSAQETIADLKKIPVQPDFSVIFEDENILVMNKPAGMLSQKAKETDISANEHLIAYLLESGEITQEQLLTFRPAVCNRLDRNTSGILLAGKTLRGLQQLSAELKSRNLQKYYRCLVKGDLAKRQLLKGYLLKDESRNQVSVFANQAENRKYIETEYIPVEQFGDYTLLEVHLITGRSHQIRAHLASLGHPVIGDPKYGNSRDNQIFKNQVGVNRQLLHAYRVRFSDGREFCAQLPQDFESAIMWLRSRHDAEKTKSVNRMKPFSASKQRKKESF